MRKFGVVSLVLISAVNTMTAKAVIKEDPRVSEQISAHYRPVWALAKKAYETKKHREFVQDEIQCLTDNVYSEAAFEPAEGQMAVATVTLNRVQEPGYPKTVCGVVYQRTLNRKNHKTVCQFSWTCKRRHHRVKSAYLQAKEVARNVYLKKNRLAGLEGVTLYHADYVSPDWAEKAQPVEQIGHHIFYRDSL